MRVVKDEENKIRIYQTLCILLQEPCLQNFQKLVAEFHEYWAKKEPEFVKYFEEYYLNRKGIYFLVATSIFNVLLL